MGDMEHEVHSARMLGCEISTNPLDPLEPILRMCESHHPDEDMDILARAYRRAVKQHSTQRRKSGEPYIIHPLAVAQILADLGMGPLVVAAGLLHDTGKVPDEEPELPQDGRGDEPRCARAGGQARRQGAQCPYLALRQAVECAEEGA